MASDSIASVLAANVDSSNGLFSSSSTTLTGLLSSSTSDSTQSVFAASSSNVDGLNQLSNNALAGGIDKYQKGDYKGAVSDFNRSINLSPNSQYAAQAATYMAQAYLKQNDTSHAIDAYKKAIKIDPQNSDTMVSLAKLYFALGKYSDAADTYKDAIKIDPSGANHFSLGQTYLSLQRYSDAENEFRTVINMEPTSADGYYGLGQTYSQEKDYSSAITQFQKAIKMKPDFWDGYFELGCTYADMGDQNSAQDIYNKLNANGSDLADTLNRYMFKVEKPQISFALDSSTFPGYASFRSKLSALDSYLANANATKSYNMVFQFNKPMDMASVQNISNWNISRANDSTAGGLYNYGLKVPSTEVKLSPIPQRVTYDPETLEATVTFAVTQNSAANGTIDPSHIVFQFSGTDQNGISMDPAGNQFDIFSGSF